MHLKHSIGGLASRRSERGCAMENTGRWQRCLRAFPLEMHWWWKAEKMGKRNVIHLCQRLVDENTGITELWNLVHPGLLLGFSLSWRDNLLAEYARERKAEWGTHQLPKLCRGEKHYHPTNSFTLKGFSSNKSAWTSVSENVRVCA